MNSPFATSGQEKQILFVFGAARSGTTYLGRILESVFDFGMGPEGHFVTEFMTKASRYGDLEEDINLSKLIEDIADSGMLRIMREKWREEIRTDITEDMIFNALPERSYAGIVYAVFCCVARVQKRQNVGNKNPGYWRYLDQLNALFPENSRYLNIVRDGRDVAISKMKMQWGQDNVLACAKSWRDCIKRTSEFKKKVGSDHFFEIRYEDLLDDPERVIQQMAEFLGIQPHSAYMDLLNTGQRTTPKHRNYRKWVDTLTQDEQRIYEAVAGDYLRMYGYETVFSEPKVKLSENLQMNTKEYLRKLRANLNGS